MSDAVGRMLASHDERARGERRGAGVQRALDRYLGIPLIFALAATRRKRPMPTRVAAIGLISLGAIGDTVLLTAVIKDVRARFPEARLVLAISHSNRAIVPLLPDLDEVVVLPILRPHACLKMLRSHRFDILADFTQWPRISAIYAALSGARFTAGFAVRDQHRHQAFDVAVSHAPNAHELENFRALGRALGAEAVHRPAVRLPVRDEASAALTVDRPYVVFHPWASGFKGWLREWTNEGYVRLAREVSARGYQVLITGSPADVPKTNALIEQGMRVGVSMTSLAGRLSLSEVAVLLSQARLVVSVSTGVAHLAAALDVPQISLYGPTSPQLWRPLSERTVVVAPEGVRAGYLYLGFEYPKNPVNCTAAITPEAVISAAEDMLARDQWHDGRASAWMPLSTCTATRCDAPADSSAQARG